MWKECLHADRIESVIHYITTIVLAIGLGFGIGVWSMKDRFEEGGKAMQDAYMNGYVVREVIRR